MNKKGEKAEKVVPRPHAGWQCRVAETIFCLFARKLLINFAVCDSQMSTSIAWMVCKMLSSDSGEFCPSAPLCHS